MDYSDIGKSKYKSDLGSGNGGGNFEYGSGITIKIVTPDDCADYDNPQCGGITEAQEAWATWDSEK